MKVSGAWLSDSGAQVLCRALEGAGHQALFVGGCVRNALMGVSVADLDMATDALPEIVSVLAEKAGFRVIPSGLQHGTVTVMADGSPLEVTTFRRDVETDGRHALVAFAASVAEDAARRDFTMNALYADRHGMVIDPLGGILDLRARRVRFVGDPERRIREDYLRILRFFRFHALYGDPDGGLDAEGLSACAALAEGMNQLSAERVGAEMRKLLAAADPAPAVSAMAQAGVLARILPGADPRALAPLVYLEGGADPDWLRRLAALGGAELEDRLRLSRAESRNLAAMRDAAGGMESAAALGWRLGPKRGADAQLLRAALMEQPLPTGWLAASARGAAAHFPVTAADLMPDLQGEALGRRLREIEVRWLASDLTLSRTDLLA